MRERIEFEGKENSIEDENAHVQQFFYYNLIRLFFVRQCVEKESSRTAQRNK